MQGLRDAIAEQRLEAFAREFVERYRSPRFRNRHPEFVSGLISVKRLIALRDGCRHKFSMTGES